MDYKYQKYKHKYLQLKAMSGGDIDINKVNDDIKVFFSAQCECVMWNFYNKPEDAYDSGKKITIKKLNQIILPTTAENKMLIIPLGRNGELDTYLDIGKEKLSYKNLFEKLSEFYNRKPMSEEIISDYMKGSHRQDKKMSILMSKMGVKDTKLYTNERRDVRKILKEKGKIYPIEIVGSLCRYEGLRKLSDYVYRVKMGS